MRGWSPGLLTGLDRGDVLPAYAGVVPGSRPAPAGKRRSPRLRGGGPFDMDDVLRGTRFSPPTRGWSADHAGGLEQQVVLPAYAGVVPTVSSSTSAAACSPRLCGGGPAEVRIGQVPAGFSPPTRGWSGRPALRRLQCLRSPRLRGGGPKDLVPNSTPSTFSPPTRGWSAASARARRLDQVLPAYAGVVPQAPTPNQAACRSPRVRGGGPVTGEAIRLWHMFSPPTRGWSLHPARRRRCGAVLPAYAGMVAGSGSCCTGHPHFPRLRGGPMSLLRSFFGCVLVAYAG